MRKKELQRNVRRFAAVLLIILLTGSVAGLAWSRTVPAKQVEEHTAYAYTKEAEVDYQVHLFPNDLFEEVQGPGRAYLTSLTDYIATELYFILEGEREAQIDGNYSATAHLTATTGGEEPRVVWERTFDLLSPQEISVNDSQVVIRQPVKVPFADYRAFAEQIREKTEYAPAELSLLVEYDINLEIQAGDDIETVEEQLNPNMIIPMRGSTFVVEGDLTNSNSGGIMESREVPVPHLNFARMGFVVSAAVFGWALTALLFLTTPAQIINPQELRISRLLKKHGERIVALAGSPSYSLKEAVVVNTFDDLLKVADELQKPILYYQLKKGSEYLLLVWDNGIIYKYFVSGKE